MLLDNPLKSDSRVEKEAISLIKEGHQVKILATQSKSLERSELRNQYKIERVLNPNFGSPFSKNYKKCVEENVALILNEDFDVLHCHDYHMLHIGTKANETLNKVLVYDAHEYLEGWQIHKTSKGILNQLKGYLVWKREIAKEKQNLKKTDYIVTITTSIANKLKNKSNAKSVTILRNIPNKIQPEKGNRYFHEKFNLPKEEVVIIYFGTIFFTDQFYHELVTLVAAKPNLSLVISGDTKRHEDLKDLTKKHNYKDVYFHTYVAGTYKKINFLAAADIGMMHINLFDENHRIGFSNKFMDYSMSGLAILGTPQEECVAINKKYNHCVFFDDRKPNSLKEAIDDVVLNYQKLQKNALPIGNDLNWELESENLITLYCKIKSLIKTN